jgi:apolipoprotein N-acyltransferase
VLAGEIKVPTEQGLTFYVRHGELFAKACAAITLVSLLLLYGIRRWRQV